MSLNLLRDEVREEPFLSVHSGFNSKLKNGFYLRSIFTDLGMVLSLWSGSNFFEREIECFTSFTFIYKFKTVSEFFHL